MGFDEIDISDDGSLVITYILKDIKTVVNVWAVKTGEKIQEYYLNPENPALREKSYGTFISDLAISQNNDFIALAGFWTYLGRQDIDPGSYLYVWHIEDGTCKEFHFKETYFIQKLCFDEIT